MQNAALFDIDNTLSLDGKPNLPLIQKLRAARAQGTRIIIVTNRLQSRRGETVQWFSGNGIPYDEMYMRPDEQNSAVGYFSFKKGIRAQLERRYKIVSIADEQPGLWEGAAKRRLVGKA